MLNVLVNWSKHTVEEVREADVMQSFVHGVDAGHTGDHVSIYQKADDGSNLRELYTTPGAVSEPGRGGGRNRPDTPPSEPSTPPAERPTKS
jgi:hypothetical protein